MTPVKTKTKRPRIRGPYKSPPATLRHIVRFSKTCDLEGVVYRKDVVIKFRTKAGAKCFQALFPRGRTVYTDLTPCKEWEREFGMVDYRSHRGNEHFMPRPRSTGMSTIREERYVSPVGRIGN